MFILLALLGGFFGGMTVACLVAANKVAGLEADVSRAVNALGKAQRELAAVAPIRTNQIANPNATLVARARQHGPVYHEQPDGQMVRLIGVDEMHGLWPEDVR